MSRYEPLTRYLEGHRESGVEMTFNDIEAVLGRTLPGSAYQHQAWWANTETHSHAGAWMKVGWITKKVNLPKMTVLFVRNGPPPATPSPVAVPLPNPSGGGDAITIDKSRLSGAAVRMLEDYAEARGCDLADAALAIIDATALERRRQLIEQFRADSPNVQGDSTDIIREARDSR